MRGFEPIQHTGSVQKVVYQGVDGDQLAPTSSHSGGRQRRRSEYRTTPWRAPCRKSRRHSGTARSGHCALAPRGPDRPWSYRPLQPVIDPADQVAVGHIANEQVEAVGNLVEMAVSQAISRQRAGPNVVGLGAGAARLPVSAIVKMPVGVQLWAGWPLGQIFPD